MKMKISSIFVCALLITTATLPVLGITNVNEIEMVKKSISSDEEGPIVLSRTDWWPMFHHDLENSGYSTSTGPETNTVLWSKELGWWVLSSPAVVDFKVYVSDATCNFYCLDASEGGIIWNYYIGSGHGRNPAVADGRVYFGVGILYSSTLCCLNAADGSHIWDFVTGNHNILSSPAVYDEKVYFGTMGQVEHDLDYYVYCIDAEGNGDGTTDMIWSYHLDDWVQSSPAIVDGKIYFGSHDYNVYCLNAADGDYIWNYTTGNYVRSSPAVTDGKVYIGSDDNNVYCLNATDGDYIWSYTTGSGVYSSPAVYDGKIYVGSMDNNVYCLNAADGSYIWSYTGSDMVSTSPAVADDKVYVATYDGNVYCLDAADGDLIWNYTTGDEIWYSPSIADGKVFIGSKDYYVYCFGYNQPPDTPSTPSGPTFLNIDETGIYNTSTIDPEENQVKYRFDWDANGSHDYSDWTILVSSGTQVNLSHSWDSSGSYVVKAQARDTYNGTSGWSNGLSVFVNSPPDKPNDPEPEDGATDIDIEADLSWSCSDPDGDNLTYDVYFEANDPTPDEMVSNNQSETTYDPGTLEYNTHYYWKIVARDEHGVSTDGFVWDFTTGSGPNNPPNPPSNPLPEDGATDVDINADLSWDCDDPDGDSLTYDIYFDTKSPPVEKVSDDQTETTFNPGTLMVETTYYWQVVAKDEHSTSTAGLVWQFTTRDNYPPDLPTINGPYKGKPGTTYEYSFTSVDPEEHDIVEYIVNWGDNGEETISGPFASGEEVTANHSWTSQEIFTIKAKAKDVYGAESNWSEFEVEIEKSRNRATYSLLFSWLFERFPLLERLLSLIRVI